MLIHIQCPQQYFQELHSLLQPRLHTPRRRVLKNNVCAINGVLETLVLTDRSVDWVDLAIVDLSLYDAPGGKQKLAAQLHDALKNIGKFDWL